VAGLNDEVLLRYESQKAVGRDAEDVISLRLRLLLKEIFLRQPMTMCD
jgi:hypothetical protein